MGLSVLTVAALAILSFVDLPLLHGFSEPHFITISSACRACF
jgi:hypothetical protein